ncbi:MAG: VCBS repeat-containing protein, partial [Tannerella sp.]|nr:VCBS repeat-containing protein [Tannerella sp.]
MLGTRLGRVIANAVKQSHCLKIGLSLLLANVATVEIQAQTYPGGASSGYNWLIWLQPETYNSSTGAGTLQYNAGSGVWNNNISSGVGNFTRQNSSPTIDAANGFNFHPAVKFVNGTSSNAPQKLLSANNVSVASGQNITTIFVLKRMGSDSRDNIITFDNAGSRDIWLQSDDDLYVEWGTARAAGKFREGLLTVDNANTNSSNTVIVYKDGVQTTVSSSSYGAASGTQVGLATARTTSTSSNYGYDGLIQEVIAFNSTSSHPTATDLQKIHSYLAVKYGITLNNTQNYLNSNGTTIWSYNTNFRYSIFGIGRDDNTNLYQKQSRSMSNDSLTVFLGASDAVLNDYNSANPATFAANNTFLMLGSNGLNGNVSFYHITGETFANGSLTQNQYTRSKRVWKAQLTNVATMTVGFNSQINDVDYLLVSNDSTFSTPATISIYPLNANGSVTSVTVSNGDYIALSGQLTGPGGIVNNLRMWLRADNPDGLTISSTRETVTDYTTNSIAWQNLNNPNGNSQYTVNEWRDFVSGTVYSGTTPSNAAKLKPVYIERHYLMNYYPALDFHTNFGGSGTDLSAFLSTDHGPMSVAKPVNSTSYLIVNAAIRSGNNDPTYLISFGGNMRVGYGPANPHERPAFGYRSRKDDHTGQPRYRFDTNATATNIEVNLFKPGQTTIADYQLRNVPPNNGDDIAAGDAIAGFNMNFAATTGSENTSDWAMNGEGTIGGGLYHTRSVRGLISEVIMYEGILTNQEQVKVNSYFAMKYGITLRPSAFHTSFTVPRFDYTLANGTTIWAGASAAPTAPEVLFYNNIAAILRDDQARLYSRQAHSTDKGSIVHAGLGGISLSYDGNSELGDFEYDSEAMIWGNNNASGITVTTTGDCSPFNYLFNRKWRFHKETNNDRPLRMLVAIQNNKLNNLGEDDTDASSLYDAIQPQNEFYMIVAASPADLVANGNYIAVIPMTYINGEWQCDYTFSNDDTYVTFGYKAGTAGCAGSVSFTGTKTFNWSQWTRQNYGTSTPLTLTKSAISIGTGTDIATNAPFNITAQSQIVFQSGVTTPRNYPRTWNNYLRLQRRRGATGSAVTTTVNFNTTVRPDFEVTDIDYRAGNYEEVTIVGYCSGSAVMPLLSYAATAAGSSYTITGNTAKAKQGSHSRRTRAKGTLHVSFDKGVDRVDIIYKCTGRVTSIMRNIYISPIRLRDVPPPPPVNEDGISFTKEVFKDTLSTCETVNYVFRIENTSCNDKYVNFADSLPEGLLWLDETLALDSANAFANTKIFVHSYDSLSNLLIDSLKLPGSSMIRFSATAVFDVAPFEGEREYDNRAAIQYRKANGLSDTVLWSLNRQDLAEYTPIFVHYATPLEPVTLEVSADREFYSPGDTVTFAFHVTNPNPDTIYNMYLYLDYVSHFKAAASPKDLTMPSSWQWVRVTPEAGDTSSYYVAGDADGANGFKLPHTDTVFYFRLVAPPTYELLGNEMTEDSLPVIINGRNIKETLHLQYSLGTDVPDDCVQNAFDDLSGEDSVRWSGMELRNDYLTLFTGTTTSHNLAQNDEWNHVECPSPPFVIASLPSSTHGTVVSITDSIMTFNTGTTPGVDTLKYYVTCQGVTDSALIIIKVQPRPDNVSDADCYTSAPTFNWGIRELTMNTTAISNYQQVLAGDIDNDGEVEIIAYLNGSGVTGSPAGGYDTNGLQMFVVRNGSVVAKRNWLFKNSTGTQLYASSLGTMAICRYNGQAYVIIACTDGYLYAYNYDGTYRWKSSTIFTGTGVNNDNVINLTDFNGDGMPEIWTGKRIFALTNGAFLCGYTGGAGGVWGFTQAVDMDGDMLPELVVGNEIYKVSITNPTATGSNSVTLMTGGYNYTGSLPTNIPADGRTHVADFDLDGQNEVLVVTLTGGKAGAYLWKPNRSGGAATLLGSYVGTPTSVNAVGPALIGNIDSDKYPEAVFIAGGSPLLMFALKYNPSLAIGSRLVQKWTLTHTDGSGCTGMSLFDFNSDGVAEICYRDETTLRIINGSGTSAVVASGNTFSNVKSGTRIEMPIIADVDNDGQAEMIINGHNTTVQESGFIRVFKAPTTSKWAPARRVWNQYNYTSVNVTDSLTVPRWQLSPGTAFPGTNGILGDGDDVYPFNNLFQQQTNLDLNGLPLWTLPDASFNNTSVLTHYPTGDSLKITVTVVNSGDNTLQSPIYLSVYKSPVSVANRILIDSIVVTGGLSPDAIATKTIKISNLGNFYPFDSIYVRLNDKGTLSYVQQECRYENNSEGFALADIYNTFYTIRAKPSPQNDTIYYSTVQSKYTFDLGDMIILRRYINRPFTS